MEDSSVFMGYSMLLPLVSFRFFVKVQVIPLAGRSNAGKPAAPTRRREPPNSSTQPQTGHDITVSGRSGVVEIHPG